MPLCSISKITVVLIRSRCKLGLHHAGADVQAGPAVGAATEQCNGAREELPAAGAGADGHARGTSPAGALYLSTHQEPLSDAVWSHYQGTLSS